MGIVSTVKTENGKISCETPEGTVVNININQRSALDCMLDAMKTIRIKRDSGNQNPAKATSSVVTLGLGVSFISVGFLSVGLAIIFAVAQPDLILVWTGVLFWVGCPFIASGVLNIVAYRYPKPFWMVATFISLLGCLAVSIAGLVLGVNDVRRFYWWSDPCQSLMEGYRNSDNYNNYYYRTEPPSRYRYYDSYGYRYRLEECQRSFGQYQRLLHGLIILSWVIMIWGICASAIALAFRLKAIFTACKCEKPEEEENDEPLLSANPPNETFVV